MSGILGRRNRGFDIRMRSPPLAVALHIPGVWPDVTQPLVIGRYYETSPVRATLARAALTAIARQPIAADGERGRRI
jgi:hypothetical protein